VGFLGAGLIAWAHGLGIQAMMRAGIIDAEFGAVFDMSERRAERFAEATGASAVGTAQDVIDRCDLVWVCTPTAAHADAVTRIADAGRAVFCEKPLAPDLAGAQAMAATVRESGIPAQVGLVLRSTPVFIALRDLVLSGELGPPMAIVFRDDQYFPTQGIYASSWRSDVAVAGGGCLIEHSIHDLDILRYCFGAVTEISGRTASFAGHPGIEDVATATMRFVSGASAALVSVWHGITSRGSTRRVEVFFAQGLVWFDDDFLGPLHVQTSNGDETRACPLPEWVRDLPLADDDIGLAVRMYTTADCAFVEAVTRGVAPEPGFDEAVVAHELVAAVYGAIAAG
jgi:predicted dehydrogenase